MEVTFKPKFSVGEKAWLAHKADTKVVISDVVFVFSTGQCKYSIRIIGAGMLGHIPYDEKYLFKTRDAARKYFKENDARINYNRNVIRKGELINSLKRGRIELIKVKKQIRSYEMKYRLPKANPTQTITKGI